MEISRIIPINFKASAIQQQVPVSKPETPSKKESGVTSGYLDNLARINAPAVQKVDANKKEIKSYKNNLRTMVRNNQSVMMAIVPRTFTAQDLNGDDKVTLSTGEKTEHY